MRTQRTPPPLTKYFLKLRNSLLRLFDALFKCLKGIWGRRLLLLLYIRRYASSSTCLKFIVRERVVFLRDDYRIHTLLLPANLLFANIYILYTCVSVYTNTCGCSKYWNWWICQFFFCFCWLQIKLEIYWYSISIILGSIELDWTSVNFLEWTRYGSNEKCILHSSQRNIEARYKKN